MKRSLFFGFAAMAITLMLAACAGTKPQYKLTVRGDYDSAFEYLSGYIEGLMKKSKVVGLSVAVVNDKEVLWTQGFGYADKANDIRATPQTMFDPASVSKLFTATAVMQLVEQGKIDLDQPYSSYVTEFSMKSRFSTSSDDITVRHLLAHHSGILGDWFKGMLSTNPEASVKYRDRFLETPEELKNEYISWPSEYTHAYSNTGYSLLGSLIDHVSGRSFFDYTETEVLEKIGMTESTFDLNPDLIAAMTKGYMKGKEIDLPQLFEKYIPAGSLATNAEELARFMMAYLDEQDMRLLKPETRKEMFTRQNAQVKRDLDFAQGLCWMISDLGFLDAGRIVFHDGGEAYSNAKMVLLLDQNIGIAILTNSVEGAGAIDTIAKEIVRTLLETKTGIKPREYRDDPPAVIKASGEDLAKLDGYYIYPSFGLSKVGTRKSKLMASSGGMKMELVPYDNGRFGVKPLLFGFIPIKIPFLDTMEFSFKEVEGNMLSGVYSDGTPLLSVGIRVEQPRLDETWLSRQGIYEAIDLGDDFPIISPWKLVEREGFLFIEGKLYGKLPFSLVLTPANDDYAFWGGLGRGSGETFTFEEKDGEILIHYSGYVYRKIK
jgi:CubicO group peptidase (beta-lactamase class C family)